MHTYVIQSLTVGAANGDPQVTIVGTVDGVQVTVQCWYSVYIQHAANAISAQNFIIGLMLQAWNAQAVPPLTNAPPAGFTVTQ